MDLETGLVLGGVLASAGIRAYGCFGKKNKLTRWDKTNLAAIVMSKGTGKTTLANSLKGYSKMVIVDIDSGIERVENENEADHLIRARDYVNNLKKELKDYKLVLMCDSVESAEFLGIPIDNVAVLTPNEKLFGELLANQPNAEKVKELQLGRMELISSCDREILNVFNSYDNLYQIIRTSFKLKNKF